MNRKRFAGLFPFLNILVLAVLAPIGFQSCISDTNPNPSGPAGPVTNTIPANTSTPTPMPTACATIGIYAPVSSITPVVMTQFDYVGTGTAFTYSLPSGETEAQSFDQFNIFAANSSGGPATMELAVINQQGVTQFLLADGTLQVPPGASQWYPVIMSGAVTNAGSIYLIAHALSSSLSIGTLASTNSAGVTGYFPSTPLPSLPLLNQTTPNYALNVHWCQRILVNGF